MKSFKLSLSLTAIFLLTTFFLTAAAMLSCPSAFGASALVTVTTQGDGSIVAEVNGSFATCTNCVEWAPDGSCTRVTSTNNGGVSLYHEGLYLCSASGNGSASCSRTLDRCGWHGAHTFDGYASDCNGSDSTISPLTIDNTPTVSVTSPSGTISAPFDITGSATFKPTLNATKGSITVFINSTYIGSKYCYTENCSYSYQAEKSSLYDMSHGGPYTVEFYAYNGCDAAAIDQKTFTVDKMPTVNVTSPSGTISAPFDITGSATFKPTLNTMKGYINIYIDSAYVGARYCYTENCFYSYQAANFSLFNMAIGGPHTVTFYAYAGVAQAMDQNTFCVSEDKDGDGHFKIISCGGSDCNDNDPTIYPGAPELCDGKDNNCDGTVDEGCDKILSYVSGNGQQGLICETLTNPFVVSANSKDVGINWQVTQTPSGSSGASIPQSVTTIEGSETISSAYLKLGGLPGSYTAEASCAECTQGSPQVFTATAKCPDVQKYYQGGTAPWANDPYDNLCAVGINPKTKKKYGTKSCARDSKGDILSTEIPYTIAAKGCAMTSMAMVMGLYGSAATPEVWNKFMVKSGGYTSGGAVQWKIAIATNQEILLKSIDGILDENEIQMSLQKTLMDKYLAKCIPVIVKVINPVTGNRHWVVVTSKQSKDYAINDPSNQFDFLSHYGEIYAIRIYAKEGGNCK